MTVVVGLLLDLEHQLEIGWRGGGVARKVRYAGRSSKSFFKLQGTSGTSMWSSTFIAVYSDAEKVIGNRRILLYFLLSTDLLYSKAKGSMHTITRLSCCFMF